MGIVILLDKPSNTKIQWISENVLGGLRHCITGWWVSTHLPEKEVPRKGGNMKTQWCLVNFHTERSFILCLIFSMVQLTFAIWKSKWGCHIHVILGCYDKMDGLLRWPKWWDRLLRPNPWWLRKARLQQFHQRTAILLFKDPKTSVILRQIKSFTWETNRYFTNKKIVELPEKKKSQVWLVGRDSPFMDGDILHHIGLYS